MCARVCQIHHARSYTISYNPYCINIAIVVFWPEVFRQNETQQNVYAFKISRTEARFGSDFETERAHTHTNTSGPYVRAFCVGRTQRTKVVLQMTETN